MDIRDQMQSQPSENPRTGHMVLMALLAACPAVSPALAPWVWGVVVVVIVVLVRSGARHRTA
ncbi:hypothetical protein [Streptomyces amakusaensis]|uniref:Uncharacterized protein n=1 Tax=Streptomyces amakusaensis TaxID=67271 RepID=A0ABW0AUJ7_9ACTN